MSDEGIREIQLNGKQLVFLFMTVTVVAVVIFLSGVMVGRGVRAPGRMELAATGTEAVTDPTAPAPVGTSAPSDGTPVAAGETLTYATRLEEATPPVETLREAPPPAETLDDTERLAPVSPDPAPAPPKPSTLPVAVPAATRVPADATMKEPAGSGFVVQVAATRARAEADGIARRLASKGYPSFVTTPAGAANVFRVRVGKFADRREAETVARRLEKEEQFKPWITR
jgi:cell division septation protein DedD